MKYIYFIFPVITVGFEAESYTTMENVDIELCATVSVEGSVAGLIDSILFTASTQDDTAMGRLLT